MQRILEGIDDYLFHMYDGLLKELQQTADYQADSKEAEAIENKYPIIREILEGNHIRQGKVLSVEVQRAMKEYVELRVNMQDDLQIKYYLRGYHDCISLLLKCGMLESRGGLKMNTDECYGDFLFDMAIEQVDGETMKCLNEQEFYQELRKEQNEIREKFSCVDEVLEGEGELVLTKEEHAAVVHYLDIQQKMDSAERREYYRFGHVHAQRYRDSVEERSRYADNRKNNGRTQCGQ